MSHMRPRLPQPGRPLYPFRSVVRTLACAAIATAANAQNLDWLRLSPMGAPTARSGHAMSYDPGSDRVVMFGGRAGQDLADTWLRSVDGWVQAAPLSTPPARQQHGMAYHAAAQRVVMFGGRSASTGSFGDTWLWDGAAWLTGPATGGPSEREGHAMVYDVARQRVVLFGGKDSLQQFADTWLFDGTTWVLATPSGGPVARAGHALAYDPARQRVVMFGGHNTGIGKLADTWEWNGTIWQPSVSPTFPSARAGHAMAYDSTAGRTVLVGGNALQNQSDSWQWDGSNWTAVSAAGPIPAPREEHALVYADSSAELLLFGGDNGASLPDAWVARGSAMTYGSGCGAPALGFVPGLTQPNVGQSTTATIANASSPLGAVSLGFGRDFFGPFPLPLSLAGFGMTGCDLLQSADIVGLAATPATATTLSFTLTLPNVQGLVGRHLYAQAYAFSPGQNPLEITVSNGIDWLIGCPSSQQQQLGEDFITSLNMDQAGSAGIWSGGVGTFAEIGGDGRHGDFDLSMATDTGVIIGGRNVYELDGDHTVIPASISASGAEQVVTDGRFFFASMILPAYARLRIVGSSPPVITVAGNFEVFGVIDVSGESVGLHFATQPTGQGGGAGGVFGGAGGAGGDRCLGAGPGTGEFNGRNGEDVRVIAGNAYAASAVGTGGRGATLYPASGLNLDQQFGTNPPFGLMYCLSAGAGGGGGGMLLPGQDGMATGVLSGGVPLPNQGVFMGPPAPGGAAMQLFPVPAGPLPSHLHFLNGGSGGGGSASNATLSLSLARSWASGAGGGGGGGAMALRAGRLLNIAPGSALLAIGGSGADYIGTSASSQVAPAGGGSGGSIVLQVSLFTAPVSGEVNVRGGAGGNFDRTGGSGIGPSGGTVTIEGGDGSAGLIRYESTSVPYPGLFANAVPPVTAQNLGQINQPDDLVSVRSKFYSTYSTCSPELLRYELLAQVGGLFVDYSDDPAVSPLQATDGAAVRLLFQSGQTDPQGGNTVPIGPWRKAVRSSPGVTGIDVDGGNAFRFVAIHDRSLAAVANLQDLVVVYR